MSQAELLLNSLSRTTDPTISSPINDLLIIDANSRIINVPSTEILFGVKTDVNAERKHFLCPRYVGDNIDLSLLKLQVYYKNALGEKDVYPITDIEATETDITFSWLLGGKLFKERGTVYFSIRAIKAENNVEVCVWNTTTASGTVLDCLADYDADDSNSSDSPNDSNDSQNPDVPNNPGGESSFTGLPYVTEADNDKTLLVVDGEWALVQTEIPEATIDEWFDEPLT